MPIPLSIIDSISSYYTKLVHKIIPFMKEHISETRSFLIFGTTIINLLLNN